MWHEGDYVYIQPTKVVAYVHTSSSGPFIRDATRASTATPDNAASASHVDYAIHQGRASVSLQVAQSTTDTYTHITYHLPAQPPLNQLFTMVCPSAL